MHPIDIAMCVLKLACFASLAGAYVSDGDFPLVALLFSLFTLPLPRRFWSWLRLWVRDLVHLSLCLVHLGLCRVGRARGSVETSALRRESARYARTASRSARRRYAQRSTGATKVTGRMPNSSFETDMLW